MTGAQDSFPRQSARTRGFTLGQPQSFTVARDGSRVAFLRTPAGDDPLASLWVYDVAEDREREVFAPTDHEEHLTPDERDRRERAGERQQGVTSYAADADLRVAAFALGDRLLLADVVAGDAREIQPAGPAFDPRPDPAGRRVAYVTGGSLHVLDLETGDDSRLGHDDDPDVSWGGAEFAAAEEMERLRGYWWAPDGDRLIACRVDERDVQVWHLASPVDPSAEPRAVRYPQAGTANAVVTLHVLGVDGSRVDVEWDREGFEYVVAVSWTSEGPPLAMVQSRDQRSMQVMAIDPDSGATEIVWKDHDEVWTHIVPGTPAWLPGGRLLTAAHRDDTRSLLIDGEPVTPAGLHVESVAEAGESVVFRATEEPTEMHVWCLDAHEDLDRLTEEPGVHAAAAEGELTVIVSGTMDEPLPVARLIDHGGVLHTFGSRAEVPVLRTAPTFDAVGPKELRIALFTPDGREPDGALPVILDPYGGPHFGRVARSHRMHLESQWFADQGFAVLVADGRGTPSRGVSWDQAVSRNLIDLALEDQVEALQAAAERFGFLDLDRVAMKGWSYGGYLTLAALLRRPDVFRAGIAGAPCTDMRLYDTHYTERYLGMPLDDPDAYANADLVPGAPNLHGELMIIHGMADDNVYVAHSLLMSKALMEAGRRHSMIPLSGITHRPTDERAAENMLRIEVDFLKRALSVA
jgi:dipeptidyl-peptidase 4